MARHWKASNFYFLLLSFRESSKALKACIVLEGAGLVVCSEVLTRGC